MLSSNLICSKRLLDLFIRIWLKLRCSYTAYYYLVFLIIETRTKILRLSWRLKKRACFIQKINFLYDWINFHFQYLSWNRTELFFGLLIVSRWKQSVIKNFQRVLQSRNQLANLSFFSFPWYFFLLPILIKFYSLSHWLWKILKFQLSNPPWSNMNICSWFIRGWFSCCNLTKIVWSKLSKVGAFPSWIKNSLHHNLLKSLWIKWRRSLC